MLSFQQIKQISSKTKKPRILYHKTLRYLGLYLCAVPLFFFCCLNIDDSKNTYRYSSHKTITETITLAVKTGFSLYINTSLQAQEISSKNKKDTGAKSSDFSLVLKDEALAQIQVIRALFHSTSIHYLEQKLKDYFFLFGIANPYQQESFHLMARVQYKLANYERAYFLAKESYEFDPKTQEAQKSYFLLAQINERQGKLKKANSIFKKICGNKAWEIIRSRACQEVNRLNSQKKLSSKKEKII